MVLVSVVTFEGCSEAVTDYEVTEKHAKFGLPVPFSSLPGVVDSMHRLKPEICKGVEICKWTFIVLLPSFGIIKRKKAP